RLHPRGPADRTENRGVGTPAREEPLTDLHEPLEPLESYPDELPPPRQRGDVNLVGPAEPRRRPRPQPGGAEDPGAAP
ncbi:hypothetical protein NGM37_20465, partial [Streptomyces sp. TRM76130]|nr:hypothetical protein [Streptomyces sp. TRM76130]